MNKSQYALRFTLLCYLMKAEIMQIMTEIPYGRVTTYGHVAEILDVDYGIKTSGRMVGKILS